MFLAIISYVLGIAMEAFIPRWGWFCYLNPVCACRSSFPYLFSRRKKGPFNKKENAFVVIMASAAANSALGTEVLAVQRLYYNITPNGAASIFLLFSSQLLGYGIGGFMRRTFINSTRWTCTEASLAIGFLAVLLYPSKMLYPGVLPLVSMFDAFYEEGSTRHSEGNKKRLKLFYVGFFA